VDEGDGEPWIDLKAAVRSFLEIRKDASTADIISLILFNTSARIVCKAMPLADLQSKLEDFLTMKGGGTSFGPALKEALDVIGDVHHQIGYPPLLMLMSDGGSGDGDDEMVCVCVRVCVCVCVRERERERERERVVCVCVCVCV
jgi:uncharacterized protein YegL